jgi:DNA-binding CsgD family transcriptional regulator
MSSIPTAPEMPTELRLDYKDLPARQLIIVIHGLPTADHVAYTPGAGELLPCSPNGSPDGLRHEASSPLISEASAIYEAAAYAPMLVTSLLLAAWRGQESRASELIAAMIEDAPPKGRRQANALADYARAVLYNGLGRYQNALAAAERACVHAEDLGLFAWALLELVEAGARANAREIALEALGQIEERTCAGGTDWALGIRARSAALLSVGDRAESLYHEAIELLGRSRTAVHLARAQLVYGEWLRRENRRVDARGQLRAAHDTFSRIAAEAFAERALHELLATAETARKRTDEARDYLTPQEAQIARLAQEGLSNPEIGAQLFISPRTVQYHLRKVFQKLNITSRSQLGRIPPSRLGQEED